MKHHYEAFWAKVEGLDVVLLARWSLFIINFWFGAVKLTGLSQATPLARALTTNTIGAQHFTTAFTILALIECVIGLMFLLPKYTRATVSLALVHMLVVCSPLVLVPAMSWQAFMIPTIEGQYILKNLALVTLMLVVVTASGDKKRS